MDLHNYDQESIATTIRLTVMNLIIGGIDLKGKPKRGTEPHRDKADYPWSCWAEDPGTARVGGTEFTGRRWNSVHLTLITKMEAQRRRS